MEISLGIFISFIVLALWGIYVCQKQKKRKAVFEKQENMNVQPTKTQSQNFCNTNIVHDSKSEKFKQQQKVTQNCEKDKKYVKETKQNLERIGRQKTTRQKQYYQFKQKEEKKRRLFQEKYENMDMRPTQEFAQNLRNSNLVHGSDIIKKQTKRMQLPAGVPIQKIGLGIDKTPKNLFNKVANNEIKIESSFSISYSRIRLKVTSEIQQTFVLKAGTIFYPKESMASIYQTLILAKDVEIKVTKGTKQIELSTMCFNGELESPGRQRYYLSNIKSNLYKPGMSQNQVWELTRKSQLMALEWIKKQRKLE